jgi:hypothetical protein
MLVMSGAVILRSVTEQDGERYSAVVWDSEGSLAIKMILHATDPITLSLLRSNLPPSLRIYYSNT